MLKYVIKGRYCQSDCFYKSLYCFNLVFVSYLVSILLFTMRIVLALQNVGSAIMVVKETPLHIKVHL